MMDPESTYLGKKTSYPGHYSPETLVAVPRSANRLLYGIQDDALPFAGFDVWHVYEFSFLLDSGLPVAGILKIIYPSNSPYIVESKSLKLYLNAFNMERQGETFSQALAQICDTVKSDLARLLQTEVQATFFDYSVSLTPLDFSSYEVLEANTHQVCNIEHYTETADLLKVVQIQGELSVCSHLLRSNCKVTFQPDWGSVYVHLKGKILPEKASLLKYIVSLRNENHFHEEICELIFKRLNDLFSPEVLMVCCLYTRRGGIDINPLRIKGKISNPPNLLHPHLLTSGTFRQ